MNDSSAARAAPEVQLRIARLVVDAGVVGPGREGLREFEARLGAAIAEQLAGAGGSSPPIPARRPSPPSVADRIASAVALRVDPHLARVVTPQSGARR